MNNNKRTLAEIAKAVGCPYGNALARILLDKKSQKISVNQFCADFASLTGYTTKTIYWLIWRLERDTSAEFERDNADLLLRQLANYIAGRPVMLLHRPLHEWSDIVGLETGQALLARIRAAGTTPHGVAINMVAEATSATKCVRELGYNVKMVRKLTHHCDIKANIRFVPVIERIKRTIEQLEADKAVDKQHINTTTNDN